VAASLEAIAPNITTLIDDTQTAGENWWDTLARLGTVIVATNQPDVGRGTLAREIVEAIHAKMSAALPLDRIEVCYDGGAMHGQPSEFRKPAPGMLLRAARELKVTWKPGPALPSMKSLPDAVRARPAEDKAVVSIGNVDTAFASGKASITAENQPASCRRNCRSCSS
jgi:beta-phosphoglucomutase-like phosphatase (HAD superfamily)